MSANALTNLWPIAFLLSLTMAQPAAAATRVQLTELAPPYESCSTWNNQSGNVAQGSYIIGFVSAAALYSERDNMHGLNISDMISYVDSYCKDHPNDPFWKAAKALFDSKGGRK
jgi:hypothetical protein